MGTAQVVDRLSMTFLARDLVTLWHQVGSPIPTATVPLDMWMPDNVGRNSLGDAVAGRRDPPPTLLDGQ